MTNFLFHPAQRDFKLIHWVEKAFSPEECQKIRAFYHQGTENVSETQYDKSEKPLVPIRKSKNVWLPWNQENDWVFKKLHNLSVVMNHNTYGFQLSGFTEDIQLTKYEAPQSYYHWHMDNGPGLPSLRKLSIVVQLSPPDNYEGGEFQAFEEPNHAIAPKGLGDFICFPSYQLHRVTPVTKGTRYSLVAWISGEPYR